MMTTTMMIGGRGSVVGNNNANLGTISMSALIDPSGEKEEENNYTDIDGTVNGTVKFNVMIALEHVCVDDRKIGGTGEIKHNNDDYNNDDDGRKGRMLLMLTMPI